MPQQPRSCSLTACSLASSALALANPQAAATADAHLNGRAKWADDTAMPAQLAPAAQPAPN